jgi:hypothetical protein
MPQQPDNNGDDQVLDYVNWPDQQSWNPNFFNAISGSQPLSSN